MLYQVLESLGEYMSRCPSLFEYLSRSSGHASKDVFHVDDVFGKDGEGPEATEQLAQLAKWIKELPSSNAPR